MSEPPSDRPRHTPGGFREMWNLAWPLILSSSFFTLQLFIDRVMLTRHDPKEVAAGTNTGMLFWTVFILLQSAAGYCQTFVAQYHGANRKREAGPVVWQALYFSVIAGFAFLALRFISVDLMGGLTKDAEIAAHSVGYFNSLTWVAMPAMIVAALTGFFAGVGDSRVVILLNGVGLAVNAALDYAWIGGHWGFAEMGIVGAGMATAVATWASAAVGFVLFWQRQYREEFATFDGWRPDAPLFGRLMRFGLPNGLQWFLEGSAFTAFFVLLGRFGADEHVAASVAFTINMVAFVPMIGLGQAVAVLVGQRLGEDRPDLAERSTYTGFKLAWGYMAVMAFCYVAIPGLFIAIFRGDGAGNWPAIAERVRLLLWFIAVYSLFDSMNLIFVFALRGAGDTLFTSAVSLVLAWPMMVLPTYLSHTAGHKAYVPWAYAGAYVIAIALVFLVRFRAGRWKSMRVIAPAEGPAQGVTAVA